MKKYMSGIIFCLIRSTLNDNSSPILCAQDYKDMFEGLFGKKAAQLQTNQTYDHRQFTYAPVV